FARRASAWGEQRCLTPTLRARLLLFAGRSRSRRKRSVPDPGAVCAGAIRVVAPRTREPGRGRPPPSRPASDGVRFADAKRNTAWPGAGAVCGDATGTRRAKVGGESRK